MQIHSLKLTVQDIISKEGDKIATVFGTLILDTGEKAKTEKGEDRLDAEGMTIPVLENIDFVIPVNSSKELKAVIQGLAVEALTLKDMEIAKKNGQLSHYVAAVKGIENKALKGKIKQGPAPIPVARRKKGKK
jgi:hypothetical protein